MTPWYLIRGRPYPVQIYQFACSYYSSNPEVGQRGAAKATRAKFNLETFSHTTVGRSFRSLESAQKAALQNKLGEEIKIANAECVKIITAARNTAIIAAEDTCGDTGDNSNVERRFPTKSDTANRRKVMAGFLPKFENNAKITDIEAAGCQFVKNWHEKSRRLLL